MKNKANAANKNKPFLVVNVIEGKLGTVQSRPTFDEAVNLATMIAKEQCDEVEDDIRHDLEVDAFYESPNGDTKVSIVQTENDENPSSLEIAARCALADLEGIMPEFEPSGDREHPGWKTIKELQKALECVASNNPALSTVNVILAKDGSPDRMASFVDNEAGNAKAKATFAEWVQKVMTDRQLNELHSDFIEDCIQDRVFNECDWTTTAINNVSIFLTHSTEPTVEGE